jgi:glycosyltransferase involved in cell wall biosynthesis
MGAADPPTVLVLTPRMPAAGGKGDQLRAFQLVRALAAGHRVEVLTTGAGADVGGAADDVTRVARLLVLPVTRAARVMGALGALATGRPAQVGWMTPGRAWRAARRRAASADVVVAVTARAVRGPLPAPVLLDHVDALSLNMRRRAGGPEPLPVRLAARGEAALLRRWERRVARWAALQAAISPADAAALPATPPVRILPNSVELTVAAGDDGERDIDVVLTGNMAYPPNADAARWLSDAIAPALWQARPDASIWVVGRAAGRLALDARIEVRADVPALAPYLRRARLALAPLRIGTGAPNKVLEAMAAGAAVVATPIAVAPFGLPPDAIPTGADAAALAAHADRLLGDEPERRRVAARGRELVAAFGPDAQRAIAEQLVREAADHGAARGSASSRIRTRLSRSSTHRTAR